MKTYWLEKRESRSVTTKGITIQEPPQWLNKSSEKRLSSVSIADIQRNCTESSSRRESRLSSPVPQGSTGLMSEERRIYSPVTFQDVARRSVANSPTKNNDMRGSCLPLQFPLPLLLKKKNSNLSLLPRILIPKNYFFQRHDPIPWELFPFPFEIPQTFLDHYSAILRSISDCTGIVFQFMANRLHTWNRK